MSIEPVLEDRFSEPVGWRWHHFQSNGRKLRFGTASPKDSVPDGVVVCLPGLSEFSEKYFEVAQDCLDRNLTFWVFDWAGQGLADRYLSNPHKRHSEGFDKDVEDLHELILGYIKHSAVHTDKGRIPLIMLGHSMGANIGLRYLSQHPDVFECAAFSAPLLGVAALKPLPLCLQSVITAIMAVFAGKSYVPGGHDWREDVRIVDDADNVFSSDPARAAIHNAWSKANPALQIGSPTFGWLRHAVKSCAALSAKTLSSIHTHCLFALAGADRIVDNARAEKVIAQMPHATCFTLEGAQHEILMESDTHRDAFLAALDTLIKETIIDRDGVLKPF